MNCLLTKLAESVNNPDIEKFATLKLKFAGKSATYNIVCQSFDECHIYTNNGVEIPFSVTGSNITFNSTVPGYMELYNYYNSLDITIDQATLTDCAIDKFKYCTGIKSLIFNGTKIHGDISALSGLTAMLTFSASSCPDVIGDIASLGAMTGLVNLFVHSSGIYGDIADFVAAQRSNGRTTCPKSNPINLFYASGNLHLGLQTISASFPYLTWDATKIALYYGTSGVDNCTSVFVYGYSAAEIATLEGQGFAVIKCD